MPVKRLFHNMLGFRPWLGRQWRAAAHFLMSRPLAEMRDEIANLREQIAALRRDTERHGATLVERVANLEALLLEHPKAQTGTVAILTSKAASFPSPAVSIVLPTWNRADVVGQAIESVLAQASAIGS